MLYRKKKKGGKKKDKNNNKLQRINKLQELIVPQDFGGIQHPFCSALLVSRISSTRRNFFFFLFPQFKAACTALPMHWPY